MVHFSKKKTLCSQIFTAKLETLAFINGHLQHNSKAKQWENICKLNVNIVQPTLQFVENTIMKFPFAAGWPIFSYFPTISAAVKNIISCLHYPQKQS
jgi:hypothetical protein